MSDPTTPEPLPRSLPWTSAPAPSRSGLLTLRREAEPTSEPELEPESEGERAYRLHRRFDRMGRLVGDSSMRKLLGSHVMVIGIGGVGSWAAEALARAGVGRLSLVDFDLVCVTNANRQLHAMRGTTGKPKVEVMAERLRAIHPGCEVEAVRSFYEADTSEALLNRGADLIIDAIDNLTAKAHLIASCRAQGVPLVVSGGASGRMDPTQIRVADLSEVAGDPFLASLRKILRQKHALPSGHGWGIPTVHSLESPMAPIELGYDNGEGFRCVCPQGENGKHTCDQRNLIYGTAGFVTGSFGLACASVAVKALV
ncbi:tRNA threonylcarbamoyladenosine dehydratase [Enhygromyxa salina]|uniref:tRNA threonylcarbamoyladenosine dehydratase n=1 Tax=Enhygromyxa salina TaxID=215803 RepID=A0A2S9XLE7_9BACT|nr:tRNA threonylcarbamoyladenosine dehydratase [Enhygromyxa salina]PRP93708.1 tRNA threonylcarbamoyladenosine dehydratase [Enhygromyxa salina]